MSKWAPIYAKDDYLFVVPSRDQVGEDDWEASKIGFGTSLVEGTLLKFRYTNKNLELSDEGKITVNGAWGDLGCWRVVILADEAGNLKRPAPLTAQELVQQQGPLLRP